ncbi:MAG: hypothetical protein KC535_01050 [Nanoarchaeota archaeon]|nr:hypothetical protein [Nanoarchaeota archaeon]
MNVEKISQYFFIIAAVVSILDGALSLSESMKAIKFIVLILAGIIVGVLKHTEEREFLISGVAVVVTGYVLVQLLGTYFFIEGLGLMLLNFIVFLSSSLVVVGIQQVGGSLTFPELFHEEPEKKKNPMNMSHQELKQTTFEKVWGIIILVAVAFTFIILLGEMFFDIGPYQQLFSTIDIIITVLFIIDLIILYEKSKGFKDFVKHNIFDIIAAVPTVGVLRGLKIIRAVRVIKSLNKGLKTTKLVKMYKTSKFFSEESYFNKIEEKKKKK